ncbi:hypothetical protein V5D56_09180 [Cellulosimicrobium sp. PMB13]|uniref:hypothetical protein n=1 Tax=Cellulosimicrobium sp. PMB13 TaxID=3120158 RepID=UPI003F4C2696
MNATLPRSDEDFARTLRDRLDAAAPTIDVDTSRVVPAARRVRRRRVVTSVLGATAVVTVGVAVGVGWTTQPWAVDRPTDVRPATVAPVAPDEETPTATEPTEQTPAAADPGWPDAPYWHVRREIHQVESNGDEHVDVVDEWFGNDRPGLMMNDGDLESAIGIGRHSWGQEFLLAGERVDMGWDVFYALPVEPAELETVLRDNVALHQEEDAREDAVLRTAGFIIGSTPAPPAVRDALWTVMTNQPTVTVLGEVRDAQGRVGIGLESVITVEGEGTEPVQTTLTRYVYDPVEHRLLEVSGAVTSGRPEDSGEVVHTSRDTYLEEGPADTLPKEPNLEDSGCVSWEVC